MQQELVECLESISKVLWGPNPPQAALEAAINRLLEWLRIVQSIGAASSEVSLTARTSEQDLAVTYAAYMEMVRPASECSSLRPLLGRVRIGYRMLATFNVRACGHLSAAAGEFTGTEMQGPPSRVMHPKGMSTQQ